MTAVPPSEPLPAAPDGYPLTTTTLDGEVIEATAAGGRSVLDAAADACCPRRAGRARAVPARPRSSTASPRSATTANSR